MLEAPAGLTRSQIDAYQSDLVGIVRKVFYRLHDVGDLHMISAGAYTARAKPLLGHEVPRNSGGEGVTRHAAGAAAIGEALERYSACWVDRSRCVEGTATELVDDGVAVLPPDRIRFFTDEQLAEDGFGMTQLGPDTTTPWLEAAEVLSGSRIFVPAQLSYLGSVPGAPRIHTATSNGLAFGTDPYEALLSGMLELVERDAFMLTWYHRLSLPRIDLASHRSLASFVRRHIAPAGLEVAVMDLSGFSNVPVALSVARQANGAQGPVGVGAAASMRPEVACMKAMREAVGSRSWAAQKVRDGSKSLVDSDWRTTIVDFDHHVELFSDPAMRTHLDFLDASSEVRSIHEIEAVPASARPDAESVAARLAERGTTVYATDVTAPDVRAGGGFVIRALSPELQPLDASYRYRYLGHPRLRDDAALSGVGVSDAGSPLNPLPHPFP